MNVALQLNVFVDVLTPDVPPVDIQNPAAEVQQTAHLVNIVDPALLDAPVSAVTGRFYQHLGDDYDLLDVVYATARPMNRHHVTVRNEVDGIGVPRTDKTAHYGSAGRLMGITVFPIPTMFDAAFHTRSHELGHQWINFLPVPPLNLATPHWPLSDLATGVVGFNTSANPQGLRFPFELVPQGDDYLLQPREAPSRDR